MISLHTNLSSLITQNNMTTSTNKLNTAIERMTTGSKINHASDNAANYSIATDMSSHISAYSVAADNIAMGMDLVSVAQETISQMQNKAGKLHALITQARNGTYGTSSIDAINKEASAIVAEINRAYNNAEYDGIGMIQKFQPTVPDGAGLTTDITPKANGFIKNIVEETPDIIVSTPGELEDAINNNTKIGIANAATLAELAKIVNGTNGYTANNCSGKTIILTEDIDLSDYQAGSGWAPIGKDKSFNGMFNGNGHKVTNLYVNRSGHFNGLFGHISGGSAGVKNLGVSGRVLNGAGWEGNGGLVGRLDSGTIDNCYSNVNISGSSYVGSLVGYLLHAKISNCYSTGNVTGSGDKNGGIVGFINGATSTITNCFSTGNVSGANRVGCLVGSNDYGGAISNCYATGNVTATGDYAGGLVGHANKDVKNCYATGKVKGKNYVGGLVGNTVYTISNSYATGDVEATGNYVGGLVGLSKNVSNCYAKGNVSGKSAVGGLIGLVSAGVTVNGGAALGNVSGTGAVGGAIGQINSYGGAVTIKNIISYGEIAGTNADLTGAFVGRVANTTDGTSFTATNFVNCQTTDTTHELVGGVYKYDSEGSSYERIEYDTSDWDIKLFKAPVTKVTLQTGLYSADTSQISFDLGFNYDLDAITVDGCTSDGAYNAITAFINTLGQKETELGAITNRLDSALESVQVSMDNLVSSRSTIQDADMSKVSSQFIRQQILQQACATLMSTANQSPSIALQLL